MHDQETVILDSLLVFMSEQYCHLAATICSCLVLYRVYACDVKVLARRWWQ